MDLKENILEYLVYPQPYLCLKTKQDIYEKAKLLNLKLVFLDLNVEYMSKKHFEIIVYRYSKEIIHFDYGGEDTSMLYLIFMNDEEDTTLLRL